jgi:hypothetical protein
MLDNKNIQKIFSLGDIRKKQLLGEVPQRTRESYREYGYFGGGDGGGSSGGNVSTVVRLDFSNDSQSMSIRGSLPTPLRHFYATGNSDYGWFAGGFNPNISPTIFSLVSRIDYSNDNILASIRGPLSSSTLGAAAIGNSNFGYFGGGTPTTTSIHRIIYSSDLSTQLVRSNITLGRWYKCSMGTSNLDTLLVDGILRHNLLLIDLIIQMILQLH